MMSFWCIYSMHDEHTGTVICLLCSIYLDIQQTLVNFGAIWNPWVRKNQPLSPLHCSDMETYLHCIFEAYPDRSGVYRLYSFSLAAV